MPARCLFLQDGVLPQELAREPVPSSVYDVLLNSNSRNLRHVANLLAEGLEALNYKLNDQLSLEHLLQEEIAISDYLTLLVHMGVVYAKGTTTNPTFTVTSAFYRKNLLEPLVKALQESLVTLTSLKTTQELYAKGEDILVDFVTCISKSSMAGLMSWAASDDSNHILELQFQSHVVTLAHDILKGKAKTTQENILLVTGQRTDVTFSSKTCVVVLELKQVRDTPAVDFLEKAHEQLASRLCPNAPYNGGSGKYSMRPVAGFVVVMCNDGVSLAMSWRN